MFLPQEHTWTLQSKFTCIIWKRITCVMRCFGPFFLSPSHYKASDRHHADTPPHTLPLMTASPLPGRGNSESAACNCCSCSWCCLWLINELLDQRENLRSHWKFWPISLLYPLQALSVYLWIQHNSYQKDSMGKQQQKKKVLRQL